MNTSSGRIAYEPEELLDTANWMRGLARSLVSDDASADDLSQETWVATLDRPHESGKASGPWMVRVMRNLRARRFRGESRRRSREFRAARHEDGVASPDELVERAELHRRVVEAVTRLDEPYRTTIILRFFHDEEPANIAHRQGIPVATVWTRIRRALDALRADLDHSHGGARERWVGALAPFVALERSVGSASGAAASAASAAGAAGTQASAVLGGKAALTMGGILMSATQSTGIMLTVASVVAVAVGFGLGKMGTDESGRLALETRANQARLENERLSGEIALLQGQLETTKKSEVNARESSRLLAEQLATLEAKMAKDAAEETSAEAAVAKEPKLRVAFGEYADLEGFANADWNTLAEAAANMNELWLELIEENGGDLSDISPEFRQRIVAENAKLAALAASVLGKIPTHAPINGEFTHPMATANLVSAMLDKGGQSLNPQQIDTLTKLGAEYESEYSEVQSEYGERTPMLTKFIDEVELKGSFVGGLRETLSEDQKALIFHPELAGRMHVDVLSPLVTTLMSARPTFEPSPEVVREKYERRIVKGLELDDAQKGALAPALEEYMREIAPLLEEPSPPKGGRLRYDDVTRAGRAHSRVLEAVLDIDGLSEKAVNAVLSDQGFPVPYVEAGGE